MNTTEITSKTYKIYEAILAADAVIVANTSPKQIVDVVNWSFLKGDADNEVLYFNYINSLGNVLHHKFTEEGLEEAFIDKAHPNELILIDHEGDEVAITLNKIVPIDPANLVYEGEGGVNKRA